MIIYPGATSQTITIQIVDDTGLAVTGLVAATFPTTYYQRAGEALPAAITLSDLAATNSAYSSGGVKELTGGYYRLDVPNAAFVTASRVRIIGEASGKHIIYPPIDVNVIRADNRDGDAIPATSGGVNIYPLATSVGERVTASTITAYLGEAGWAIGPVVVTDADGDPVDLTDYTTLRLIIEDQYGTDLLNTTSITVSGASNNQWSATGTSAVTTTAPARHMWALRGQSTGVDIILGHGPVEVVLVAKGD